MRQKHLLSLLAVTVVLVAVAFWISRREARSGPAANLAGRLALPGLPLDQVQALCITLPGGDVVDLRHGEKAWTVASRFGYPADFSRIAGMVGALAEMKVVQEIAAGPTQHARLDLAPPDAAEGAGCRIEMLNGEGQPLARFLVGKNHLKKGDTEETAGREWPIGRYLLLDEGEGRIVLVGDVLTGIGRPSDDWLDKSFPTAFALKSARLERDGKTQWHLARNATGEDFVAAEVPAGRTLEKAKADAIGRALAYARFATVADPGLADADTGLDQPAVFTAETFDGLAYTLRLGKERDGMRFVRIAIAFQAPPAPPVPETATDEDKETLRKAQEEKATSFARKAQDEQARHGNWTYLFTTASVEAMLTDPDALFPPPPPEDASAKK
jgi:hypothetical protein